MSSSTTIRVIGGGAGALEAAVWPPLPWPLARPLNLVLGTAGALPISCDLPGLAVKLRVSRSAPGGGEGGFIGGEVEDEEGGVGEVEAGDQRDASRGSGGVGRVNGGGSADGEEVEEEEGIAAGEGTVEAVEGIGIGV